MGNFLENRARLTIFCIFPSLYVGGAPYPSVGNHQLLNLLKQRYRMEKPEFCSDEMLVLSLFKYYMLA